MKEGKNVKRRTLKVKKEERREQRKLSEIHRWDWGRKKYQNK
jgi:hypothetical protein